MDEPKCVDISQGSQSTVTYCALVPAHPLTSDLLVKGYAISDRFPRQQRARSQSLLFPSERQTCGKTPNILKIKWS
jgi:hypothetical protein